MARRRLPGSLRLLLGASLVSAIGTGLTLPFLIIYLHQVRHISLAASGLLIATVAVVALPVAPLAGALVDRHGPRAVMITALSLEAVGIAALATVHSAAEAIPVMLLYGLGQAANWPTWNALLGVIVDDPELRPLAFARHFQLLNLGIGIGSIIAGLVVRVAKPGTFEAIYLIDGATNLVLVAGVAVLPRRLFQVRGAHPSFTDPDSPEAARHDPERSGYRAVLADRVFRRYLVVIVVMMSAGYAALNTGAVGFATTVVKAGPAAIAVAYAFNTSLIVIAQPLGLWAVERMRRTTALAFVSAWFALAWIVLAAAGLLPGTIAGRVLVVAFYTVFAIGEVFLSPANSPLVNELAPPALRGRYFALSAACFTVANIASPAIAGIMLGAGLGYLLLGLFVACCLGAMVATRWLRRAVTDEQDGVGGQAGGSLAVPGP